MAIDTAAKRRAAFGSRKTRTYATPDGTTSVVDRARFLGFYFGGAAATLPTIIVEAAFGSTPLGARVWTDITDAVKSITVKRGKSHLLGQAEPGRATFKIWNTDRRFDPSNSSSAFSPNVKLRTPIRVRVTWNAVTYNVWLGFVRRWFPTWDDGVQSDTIVDASGILDFISGLRGSKLPGSPWEMVVRQTPNKRSWWRLGEAAAATQATDQIGGYSLDLNGKLIPGAAGLITGDTDTAATTSGISGSASTSDPSAALVGDFTVVMWFKGLSTTGELMSQGDPFRSSGWRLTLSSGVGQLTFNVQTVDGFTQSFGSTEVGLGDNVRHMFIIKRNGTALSISVDNGTPATAVLGSTGGFAPDIMLVATTFAGGVFDEIVTFDRATTAAEDTALYDAGANAWANDPTGTRIARILDWLGITTADRNIDTGNTTVQGETGLGQEAFTYIEQMRHAENAELFEGGDGKINYHSRQHRLVPPWNTSQATFSNLNTATNPIKRGGVAAPLDDQDVYNDIPVSRTNGISYRAADQTSKDANGTKSLPGFENLPLTSDLEVVDAANWLLARYKDPRQRLDALVIDPFAKPAALFPQVFGREIGDRITVSHQPPGGGPPFVTDQIIEGVEHVISVDGGLKIGTTFALSTADAALYLVFDDTVSGVIGTGAFAY